MTPARVCALALFIALAVGLMPRARGENRAPPANVWSSGWATWIYPEPRKAGQPLGYLRPGTSARLREPDRITSGSCPGGFVAIEPRGYVCLDNSATLDGLASRYVLAMQATLPRSGPLPFQYALSNGAPMYQRLPTAEEWQREERRYGAAGSYRPQYWGNRGHERLAEVRVIEPDGAVPFFLQGGGSLLRERSSPVLRRQIPHGSMLSFTRSFEHLGRSFLLSADGTVVPADRVRPYRASRFRGVQLSGAKSLPIAWIRSRARPRFTIDADGHPRQSSGEWPLRSHVALDVAVSPLQFGRERYLATRENDAGGQRLWILQRDATLAVARPLPSGIGESDKWIWVSITSGVLIASVGRQPVFTTLVSPGAGGVPVPGNVPVKASTTPLGTYRITFKHRTDDMSPEQGDQRSFWLADVPYAQYFNMPFALHTAYWHEDFGEPMSAGCINVSPADGQFLFNWTAPQLPEAWHGVIAGGPNGKGSFIVIVR